MKQIFIFTTTAIFLVGCGGSDKPKDRVMEIDQSYSVISGDKVIKTSENTLIEIMHTDGKKTSTVKLLEGNATIIHK